MTHKERIDAVMRHQPCDRTPFALVDGGAWIAKMENKTYREMYASENGAADLIVKYTNMIDTDLVSAVSGVFTAPLNAYGCPLSLDESGSPVNTGTCITDPETEIPLLDKSKIRETLLANDFFRGMLRQCKGVYELVGEEKHLMGDIAGPFTMASVMVGMMKFIRLIKRKPELVAQLMDFTTALCIEVYHLLAENGCSITLVAEPVASGSMISPKMYGDLALPALLKVKEALTEYKYFFAHICGESPARVIPLRDAGIDAFSCDYLVPEAEFLDEADGRLVMFGNLEPAGKLVTGTPEDVYEESCERIRIAAGRGFILAPGCDLVCTSPFENVAAMSRACKDMAG